MSGLGIYPQRLKELRIFRPTGSWRAALAPKVKFAYSAPTTTGESLLSQMSECDGNDVCKRPTRITWEAGSTQYDVGTTLSAITDLQSPAAPINTYRRIMVADLNNDGRDDIVYRVQRCYAWIARLAQPGGTFGDPIESTSAFHNDLQGTSTAGQLASRRSDLHGPQSDAFPDILVAQGVAEFPPKPRSAQDHDVFSAPERGDSGQQRDLRPARLRGPQTTSPAVVLAVLDRGHPIRKPCSPWPTSTVTSFRRSLA